MKIKGFLYEEIYAKLEKCINLAKGYTEYKYFDKLVKACRLKPVDYLNGNLIDIKNTILYRKWVDEFGTSISFKKKKMEILVNDLDANIVCTDNYRLLNISNVAKISSCAYLLRSKLEDVSYIIFHGIDGYFRAFMYFDNWAAVSPLLFGLKHSERILKFDGEFSEFNYKKMIEGCDDGQAWLFSLPLNGEGIKEIKEKSDIDFNFG